MPTKVSVQPMLSRSFRGLRAPRLRHPATVRASGMLHRPRRYPTSGFEVFDASHKVEEEKLPSYREDAYYPMEIGEVVNNRYQVVTKLGYGTSSTVWLCRDLATQERTYWAIKVHVRGLRNLHELQVYQHLGNITSEHPGRKHVRACEDTFTSKGPSGDHQVLVMTPLGLSLRRLQDQQEKGVFEVMLVSRAVSQILLGLDFLHASDVIHADLHADNMMVAMTNPAVLADIEESEVTKPAPRKQGGDRMIYFSRTIIGGAGPLTICDLGQARIGPQHQGLAMPTPYRAPEVILGMTWDKSIDVWTVGLMAWDLLESKRLFRVYDDDSSENNNAHHLAAMTALLGPPPPTFLARSSETSKYWTDDGQWKGPVPLPPDTSIESLITSVHGEEREKFANFIACCLGWEAQDRLETYQAIFHPWLQGGPMEPADDQSA